MPRSKPAVGVSLVTLGLCLLASPALGGLPGVPTQMWSWAGDVEDPAYPWPATTPLVAQITDDNGDGAIDGNDVADVLFLHFGAAPFDRAALTVLDGATGAEHYTVTSPGFGLGRDGTPIAVGDGDGDGRPEIFVTDGSNLIALNDDGSLDWSRPWLVPRTLPSLSIGLADFNQDGVPEIYSGGAVMSVDGSMRWNAATPSGVLLTSFSNAADVLPSSPGMELLWGNVLYSSAGATLWTASGSSGGGTGIGDVDGDGAPDIVLVSPSPRVLLVLDANGVARAPGVPLPGGNQPSAPLVADLDGDLRSEIVVQVNIEVQAYEWNGTGLSLMWTAPGGDSSCCGGVSGFDFDGDGITEVVYRDESDWYVVNGPDGAVLHQEPFASATGTETPIVADIDGDCIAEIVVNGFLRAGTHENSVVAYKVPGSVVPRPIWNQQTYHSTNITDLARVPVVEAPAWTTQLSWMTQVETTCCPFSLAPAVADMRICAGSEATLDATGLTLPSCSGTIQYEWRDGSGLVVGNLPLLRTSPGSTTDYEVTVTCSTDPTCLGADTARVTVDAPPVLGVVTATDHAPCNLGIHVQWPPATFSTGAGGTYHVFRSEAPAASACADALAQPPIASPLAATELNDTTTQAGRFYTYVVVAEDASAPTACPNPGPTFGGAQVWACTSPPIEDVTSTLVPDGVYTTLFARHSGQEVTLSWPTARALLPDEHFVIRKAWGSPTNAFVEVGAGDDAWRQHVETDVTDRRQYFELRVADPCGNLSDDEYPPGW